jgi:hypothetical protein
VLRVVRFSDTRIERRQLNNRPALCRRGRIDRMDLPRKEGLIMFSHLAVSDELIHELVNDRLREAERIRLADQARGPGRPVRAQVAGWLFAIARRIEGQPQPQARIVHADA